MKFILLSIFFLFYSTQSFSAAHVKNDPLILEVDLNKIIEAENKKLPQTAIDLAKKLELKAKGLNNKGMFIRALTKRILNECHVRGKMPKDKINILKEEIAKVEPNDRPLIKIILANWYWHYYEQNRFKFSARTKTQGLTSEDFTTWDLPKIFEEIKNLFEDALKEKDLLKKTNIDDYNKVINRGNLFTSNPVSLYEFALREYIQFSSQNISSIPAPQDKFEIDLHSKALAKASAFIKYKPETTDTDSYLLKSIELYQELMQYYSQEKLQEQFIDTDINRLKFINAQVNNSEASEIYLTRLKEIENEFSNYPSSTLASFEIASNQKNSSENINAIEICSKAIQHFPNSDGGKLCQNLINEIKAPAFSAKTESSINQSNSSIFIKYKNITKLYFRIVEEKFEDRFARRIAEIRDDIWDEELNEVLLKKPLKEWSVDLAETTDFKELEIEQDLPEVPYGFYRLIVSSGPQFYSNTDHKQNEQVTYSSFWRTDTMLLAKGGENKISGFVLDTRTGEPLENTTVEIFQYKYSNTRQKMVSEKLSDIKTNREGHFEFSNPSYDLYLYVKAKKTGDTFYDKGLYQSYNRTKSNQTQQVLILTDRAIYRPEQRIHYKAICYSFDQIKDKYQTEKCNEVHLSLYDTNHKEILTQVHSSNDFGSFSGDFIAPKNVLTGTMSIEASSPFGQTTIQVEEYKRPKFEVTLNPPTKQFKLGDTVTINGKALSYSGAPLINAKVKYRILRGVQLPAWWYWGNPYQAEQEISNGTIHTNDSGEFKIDFEAKPNKSVELKSKPIFHYNIMVDVIDPSGETRSGNISTNIGTVALKASMKTALWLTEEEDTIINIATQTNDGMAQDANGTIEIYSLKSPSSPKRAPSTEEYYWSWYRNEILGINNNTKKDMSKIESFESENKISEANFESIAGIGKTPFKLLAGAYQARLMTKDLFGNPIVEKIFFYVLPKTGSKEFSLKLPSYFKVKNDQLKVGDTFHSIWGTGYRNGPARVEITQNGEYIKSYWINEHETFHEIDLPITEKLKGGFQVQIFFVHENQVYHHSHFINVTRPEKQLKLTIEKMSSKLRPSQTDTWTLKIAGDQNKIIPIEMLATMYDESLDTFMPHYFQNFVGFWQDQASQNYQSTLTMKDLRVFYTWDRRYVSVYRQYPTFANDIKYQFSYLWPYREYNFRSKSLGSGNFSNDEMAKSMKDEETPIMSEVAAPAEMASNAPKKSSMANVEKTIPSKPQEKSAEVKMRRNLNETAFFYPHLLSDKEGRVGFEFTMPEALTKWKFMAFAHGKNNESGMISETIVTEQELMVTPNAPRFVRQGDKIFISAKVDNTSNLNQKGQVELELINAMNDRDVSLDFAVHKKQIPMSINAKKSETFSWEVKIPDVTYPLIYRIKAKGNSFSDGEEGLIPILARKIFVQESIPLWITGAGTKNFTFDKLIKSESSKTLSSEKLVLQMVSNPVWYAVQAIPYLEKEYPECTDYVFERLFANSLGAKIIENNPGIEKIFKSWQGSDALKSNLQKNTDLKKLSLEETPWVKDAENEEKSKQNISKFFEKNNLSQNLNDAYLELERRMAGRGWPWIPGGEPDHLTTLYITTGFGKLRSLKVDVKMDLAIKSIEYLDEWIKNTYDNISAKELNHYDHIIAYYLYGRSYFLKDVPIKSENKIAIDYFLAQAKKFWTSLDSRSSEANTALALNRFNDEETAKLIIKSLKERALHSPEMGMYWADEEWGYWWYRAPIEAQARIIELFREIGKHEKEIDEMNIWLIKQKQTQDWKTSRATADVIFTLLQSGRNLLNNNIPVDVELGGQKIVHEIKEAGTNYFEKRFNGSDIKAQYGNIKLTKKDKGIAWGGVHWQYFEDIAKITPHKTPLSLNKSLWVKRDTKKGPTLFPLKKERLALGDTIVVRIELRSDRDMEYIHMKDMRGSGTEPINTLSTWKYQDGLAYYESTRDTATNFFIPYLPKGTYVFEYDLKIFQRGTYQSGLTEIQSLYAPEFSSHSESILMNID
jgi:5-hydroxyisourate hydrolase-like protein (transthyretin family)